MVLARGRGWRARNALKRSHVSRALAGSLRSRRAGGRLPGPLLPPSILRSEFSLRAWRVGQLSIERLPIANAPTQELRPIRDGNIAGDRLRQQSPELRVMPTQ